MMEDAEPPEPVPYLEISQEISPLAARDYLQARDEVAPFITSLPPFRAQGNTAFLYYNPEKEGVYIYVMFQPYVRISLR